MKNTEINLKTLFQFDNTGLFDTSMWKKTVEYAIY